MRLLILISMFLWIIINLNSYGQNEYKAKNINVNLNIDWNEIDNDSIQVDYYQFNFDPFPMKNTSRINILDTFNCHRGWSLSKTEIRDLKRIITKRKSFDKGECGTFYVNAGLVFHLNDTVKGLIKIGCSYGQWIFIPENKYSNDNILSKKGYKKMSKLLDEINEKNKNARTHNMQYSPKGT